SRNQKTRKHQGHQERQGHQDTEFEIEAFEISKNVNMRGERLLSSHIRVTRSAAAEAGETPALRFGQQWMRTGDSLYPRHPPGYNAAMHTRLFHPAIRVPIPIMPG